LTGGTRKRVRFPYSTPGIGDTSIDRNISIGGEIFSRSGNACVARLTLRQHNRIAETPPRGGVVS